MDLLEAGVGNRHPWELSRGDCILSIIKSKITSQHRTIADIGCGDLYFANILSGIFDHTIFAIDTGFTNLLSSTDKIVKMSSLEQMDDDSIDIAILMDVLEHIEKPDEFLHLLSKKMRGGGISIFTVPAFQHLFSEHDVFLKHHRRYNKKQLYNELVSCGFNVERIFFFYTALYVPRLLQFAISNLKKNNGMAHQISMWKHDENSKLTNLVRTVLNLDFSFNKNSILPLPFGLSVCAICSAGK